MRNVSKNPVIIAGLVGVLAFCTAGCSFSSESSSTTTVETSVTDEDGNTTTTRQTNTVTSGGGSQDAEASEESSGKAYTNEYYGIEFILPTGFESSELKSDVEYEDIDYYATDEDGNNAKFILSKQVTELEGITDADSWAEVWGDAFEKALADNGDTDIELSSGTVTIGGAVAPALHVESNSKEEGHVYRDIYFLIDEDGDGMRISLTALDEDTLQTLRDSIVAITA